MQVKERCRYGYYWIEDMEVCYKITENGSWNETIAACMNDWPTYNMDGVNHSMYQTVISHLQTGGKLNDAWLPIRRSSVFGHFLYYSFNNGTYLVKSISQTLTYVFMYLLLIIFTRSLSN